MIDSIFDTLANNESLALILCLLLSFGLGLVLSIVYMFNKRKDGFTKSIPITILILPIAITLLVALINIRSNQLSAIGAGGIALAGIFVLARFRSDPLNPEDLVYIFLTLVVGIGVGIGYLVATSVGVAIFAAILIAINLTRFGEGSKRNMTLKIVVPEDLNYEDVFDEVLVKYCQRYSFDKVRTVDLGQLFELTFHVTLKKDVSQKTLIDELRSRNGNLTVLLTMRK